MTPRTKRCTKCGESRLFSQYERHPTTKDGFHTYCKECIAVGKKAYYQANKASIDAKRKAKFDPVRHRVYTKAHRQQLRLDAISFYGGVCECCKESHIGFLTIDHTNNNGAEHRREIGNGRIYSWLRKNNYPKGFRVLCYNCNCAIGAYGTCPHQDQSAGHLPGIARLPTVRRLPRSS